MNTNQIIDADLTDRNQFLSNKTLAIIKITGVLSMILGGVSIFQILSGFAQTISTAISFSSFSDMGGYKYYMIAGMFNRFVNMILNVFAAVFLFRYAILATKGDKSSFGNKEWETIFQSIRNMFIVFGLMNISWFLFSILNIFIGQLI